MPKAYLVSADVEMGIGTSNDIMDMSGRAVASYHSPRRYTYKLTYVSTEPMDSFRDFPNEIDTENMPDVVENKLIKLELLD